MTSTTLSTFLKTSAAALAIVGATGLAVAQGNPPTTSSPNPATGAGQQAQGGTPMGTTGTPATPGAGTTGSAASGSTGGTMSSTDTTTSGSSRMARADRN